MQNVNTVNTAAKAAEMSMMNEPRLLAAALARIKVPVLLAEDDFSRICWTGAELLRYRPGARRGWTCRKITARQLAKVAPALRVLEVLQEIN